MSVLSSGFSFLIGLVKFALLATLLLAGLLLGLLITIKVLLVLIVIKIWRTFRTTPPPSQHRGQVFDGDFRVVTPSPGRATVLMVGTNDAPPPLRDA